MDHDNRKTTEVRRHGGAVQRTHLWCSLAAIALLCGTPMAAWAQPELRVVETRPAAHVLDAERWSPRTQGEYA